jgi:hypothetical protein
MALEMPDSITVVNLPAGYPAYLGYVDGEFVTMPGLKQRFPDAYLVGLTVTGATLIADGCDIETGDLSPWSGAHWASHKLAAAPASRPVMYSSVSRMPAVIGELEALGVKRSAVRLHSAHYWGPAAGPHEKHICGPATCNLISIPMDATQWTDHYPGNGGTLIDMSELTDTFVAPPLEPITVLPPGRCTTAVIIEEANGEQYVAQWDGKAWHQVAGSWPVKRVT